MRAAKSIGWRAILSLSLGAAWSAVAYAGPNKSHRYRLYDVGTLGGPLSLIYNFDQVSFTPTPLNERGQLAVTSLTAQGNAAAALWSGGALRALPGLPNANVGGGGSNANGVNAHGVVVGAADDGIINPLNGAPYDHAVLWDGAGVHRLQELDGHASWASSITDRGIVAGYAYNAVADPYTYAGTQTRAAIWRDGAIQVLGTLGGTDSAAFVASDCAGEREEGRRGVAVIGTSSLATAAGPPFGIPQTDAFLWEGGVMIDLGGLGGGYSMPSAINCRRQVTVISFDATHRHFQSFLWSDGRSVPLERLGGSFVEAVALNDAAMIAGGVSDRGDENALAAVWGPSGEGALLGTIGKDTGSLALGVNARGVVVGGSGALSFYSVPAYSHAFVWRRGGAMQDLNTLIPEGSPLTLNVAYSVNDRGDIAGLGTSASGETHAFVLVTEEPCEDGGDARQFKGEIGHY